MRVSSVMSDKFSVKMGVHQGSVLSPLLLAIVINVVTKNARNSVLHEILYAVNFIKDVLNHFCRYEKVF